MKTRAKPKDELAGLLADGDRGTLMTEIGGQLQVRVAQRAGDVVLLVLTLGADDLLEADRAERAVLECPGPHGVARLRGEVEVEGRGLVRFHIAKVDEVIQRRRFFRVQTAQRVELANDLGRLKTYTVDISGGGMLLTGPESLEAGDEIRFCLYLGAEKTPIEGQARVVRTDGDGRRAIAFDEFPRQDEERLIRFLFDRQRAERAVTRGDAH